MIYPSHYGDGNFGIDHPDMEPYRTIRAALKLSRQDLESAGQAGKHQAIVRPWLQDFTASYLKHHIPYGAGEVRAQIQAFMIRVMMSGSSGAHPTGIPGKAS